MKSKWNKLIKPKWFGQQSYKIWKIIQLVKCKWRLHRVYKTRLDGEYKIVAWRFCCFYPQYVISTIIICTLTSVLFRPLGASAQHFPLQVSIMPRAALHVVLHSSHRPRLKGGYDAGNISRGQSCPLHPISTPRHSKASSKKKQQNKNCTYLKCWSMTWNTHANYRTCQVIPFD